VIRERNGLRIMLRERPLGQDSELKPPMQQLDTSRKLQRWLKTHDQQPETLKKRFPKVIVAVGDSLSNIARSDDGEDGEDENDPQTEQSNQSEDDEPGWVMGTISTTVQHCIERFRQKKMNLDELTHPGLRDAADYFRESDKKQSTAAM
jgi:hypothetical protein